MDFIPAFPVLLAFTAGALIIIFTPGPDMTLFLGQTLRAGRPQGFAAMFGACTGLLVHSSLAAFGLSALLVASATAFTIVKFVGAGYLLFLAWQALRHGSSLTIKPGADGANAKPPRTVFWMGLAINLLNPKIVMFFLTFLPQFITPSDPHAAGKLLFLGIYFTLLCIPFCIAMILAAERFTSALRRSPRAMRAVDWSFAGIMSAFAVKLLLSRN